MEIKVNLDQESIEKLNRLTTRYNATIDELVRLWIINETNLMETRDCISKLNTQDNIQDYMEDTEEYEDNPFGEPDDDEDLDDWDFFN